jgi:hypothetical protein
MREKPGRTTKIFDMESSRKSVSIRGRTAHSEKNKDAARSERTQESAPIAKIDTMLTKLYLAL